MPARAMLLLAVLLSGCTPYAQRVSSFCRQLGATPGSQHYWDCVHQQMAIDQRDRAMWAGTTAVGAQLMQGPPNVYVYGR